MYANLFVRQFARDCQRKHIISFSSAELAQRSVMVRVAIFYNCPAYGCFLMNV